MRPLQHLVPMPTMVEKAKNILPLPKSRRTRMRMTSTLCHLNLLAKSMFKQALRLLPREDLVLAPWLRLWLSCKVLGLCTWRTAHDVVPQTSITYRTPSTDDVHICTRELALSGVLRRVC